MMCYIYNNDGKETLWLIEAAMRCYMHTGVGRGSYGVASSFNHLVDYLAELIRPHYYLYIISSEIDRIVV